jgi:hypothetical protein
VAVFAIDLTRRFVGSPQNESGCSFTMGKHAHHNPVGMNVGPAGGSP